MEQMNGDQKEYKWKKGVSRIFWGIVFILAALAVVLNLLGVFGDMQLSFWTVIFSIVLLLVFIASILNVFWFGIFFALGFAFMLYKDMIAAATDSALIADINNWAIIGIALLLSIGFSILFRKKDRKYVHVFSGGDIGAFGAIGDDGEHFESVVNQVDGSEIVDRISFGSKIRYINSENFKRAFIECSFGAMKFYFDNAHIIDGTAEIKLDLSFSGAELYIPKNWRLVDNIQRTATGIEEKNRNQIDNDSPVVTLSGSSKFSGLEIIYI